ncbi:SGNH/GDSL hydrolase family protein [Arthrobacter nitrophenolicus]|uniref:Lysophospholipase L1-like esterase n=1 Tax=Arthrobacter nitrophenolicus TaxID=683150 RepID=A0ACC6TDD3_9MICC
MRTLQTPQASAGSPAGRIGAVAAAVIGLLAGPAAIPAAAYDDGPLDYVAFGDSYTAGIGAGVPRLSLLYPIDPADPKPCYQASPGYVDVLDALDDIDLAVNAACAGATAAATTAVAPTVPEQITVASDAGDLDSETDLVTITAGANDVNFINALLACLTRSEAECRTAVDAAEALAQSVLPAVLAQDYGAIQTKAPNATIAALGYPHLFAPEFAGGALVENIEIFNAGTDTLNKIIRDAAKSSGAVYVEVTDDFAGHGIGAEDPWINFNPADPLFGSNFHPTAEGYAKGYAAAVVEEVEIGELAH